MKILKGRFILLFSLLLCSICLSYSCKKMDDSYKKYVVTGGLTYPGKATTPEVFAGRGRVKLSWLRGTDPSVVKARVFWNNFLDSVEVTIPPTGDTISTIIENLAEQQYTFDIVTYDKQGNKSVAAEVLGASYGAIYQSSLLSRPITQVAMQDEGVAIITWGAPNINGGAYATEVSYTSLSGSQASKQFLVKEDISGISDIKPNVPFKYRTIYLPDSLAIDTFYTAFENVQSFLFDKSSWKVIAYSTEHDNSADNRVENVIDGDPGTRWHTNVNTSNYPHYVVVDMQKPKSITAFEIFRMKGDNRACDRFELAISNDNVSWQVLGDYDFDRNTDAGQMYPVEGQPKARYFKFTGLSGPTWYMVTGEISVYGHE